MKDIHRPKHRPKPAGEKQVVCHVCLREVPISSAMSEEASDYVLHFCGLVCYEKWRSQQGSK